MCLNEKACLVTLKISQWTARKLDKKATQDVCSANATTEAWTKATKALISDSATKPIRQLANEARIYHYSMTLPWDDNGARMLPTKAFMKYVERMNSYKDQYNAMVLDLLSNYDQLRHDAKIALNGLFREADYPSDLSSKYDMNTSVTPIPQGDDLRIGVDQTELDKLRRGIESDVQAKLQSATEDVWKRIKEVLSKCKDTLADKDKVFRDSLIGNVQDLVGIIPMLNIMDDPKLDDIAYKAKQFVASADCNTLRKDPVARQQVATKATEILNDMSWFKG